MDSMNWPVALVILVGSVLSVYLVTRVCWWLMPAARLQVAAFQQLAGELGGTFSRGLFSRYPRVTAPHGRGRLVVELATDADDAAPQTLVAVEGVGGFDRNFSLEVSLRETLDRLPMSADGVRAVRALLALAPGGRARILCRPKSLLGPGKAVAEFDGLLAEREGFAAEVRTAAAALERIAAALSPQPPDRPKNNADTDRPFA